MHTRDVESAAFRLAQGAALRSIRKRVGLTQKELAEKLGYASHSYISEVEAGKKPASSAMLYKLYAVLNVSIDAFFDSVLTSLTPAGGKEGEDNE